MFERYVYFSRFDAHDHPVALLNRTASWSPRDVDGVIDDIESNRVRYIIEWASGPVEIRVRLGRSGPELAAAGPGGWPDGLKELPRA